MMSRHTTVSISGAFQGRFSFCTGIQTHPKGITVYWVLAAAYDEVPS